MALTLEHARSLAPLTTLGLGGNARFFAEASSRQTLMEALRWAREAQHPVFILGSGSNVVVSDAGVSGLVIKLATRGLELADEGAHVLTTAQAGEPLQALVELSLGHNLAGLECLTGIPGLVGATPIQNVGAYGQEVADTIEAVELLDRADLSVCWRAGKACGFGYRTSNFKRDPERYVVLAVRYRLLPHGAPRLVYPELVRAVGAKQAMPSLREVAETVWELRAHKSMVLDPSDANTGSAGSFFANPIVPEPQADCVRAQALAQGMVNHADDVPCYPLGAGMYKLAAGWLIERAGVHKGLRRGAVGVSSRHALALVHHGGGSTGELLALAAEIQQRVHDVFGVMLEREPVLWG